MKDLYPLSKLSHMLNVCEGESIVCLWRKSRIHLNDFQYSTEKLLENTLFTQTHFLNF